MANPVLLVSGIGMVLFGILAPLYWKRKAKVKINYFFWGAGVWVLAVAVKIAMDYTVTPALSASLGPYGVAAFLVVMGLYLGLRTGFLESGLSYLVMLRTRLMKMNYREGIAFGIGFGSIEAIFLGVTSFLNVLLFLMVPDLITMLPEAQQAFVLMQLDASSWVVFGPIIERISIMFIHVFSTLLVLCAIRKKRTAYLWISILFKAMVDGIIPWLLYSVEPLSTVAGTYLIETPFIILAVISYFGIGWMRARFR
jgi:uncharacterized membrane protein YhfC